MESSKEILIQNHDKLRPYQKKGVNFLVKSEHALLADEMGLGKTVQTLVALDLLFHEKTVSNALIICPAALTFNWKREINTWCPSVSSTIIKGNLNNRKALFMLPFNIWITTFEQIRSDMHYFISLNLKFDLVILDEVQRIKNKNSNTSLACKLISRKKSWALSGTPLENNIDDLISVFSFVNSGLINQSQDIHMIKSSIKSYFLRRTKKEVLKDLPPILYQDLYLELNPFQKDFYDNELIKSNSGLSEKSQMSLLFAIITSLKQLCNFEPNSEDSSKYDALKNILDKAIWNKKKILIFSQYVKTLEFIKNRIINDFNISPNIFHGGLKKEARDKIINDFEKSIGFNLLLISLKAGGVGLNLNSASIVVMFDRWWNPAVEDQAIQRAHRFGKKDPLNVIKFIVVNSIEEKIDNIIKDKKELFESVINDAETALVKAFSKEDLFNIISRDKIT